MLRLDSAIFSAIFRRSPMTGTSSVEVRFTPRGTAAGEGDATGVGALSPAIWASISA